jgi:uncharacterized protein involved in exopolysaccharide biosynthesis
MELELNAQYYLDVVLRQWKVVLVVFIVATLAALAVSLIQEPTYEATVSLAELTYDYFDVPRLSPLDRTVVKLYPALARTEAVESRVVEAIGSSLSAAEKTPGTLMSMVTVREDKDNPALFRIRVQANDPGKAKLIANTWAEQYMEEVGTFQLALSSELETVKQGLESAEAALTEFREETGLGLVEEPGSDQAHAILGPRGVLLAKQIDLLAEHQQARDNLRLILESAQLARDTSGSIDDLPLQLLNNPAISERGRLSAELVRDQETLEDAIQLLLAEENAISGVIDQLDNGVEQLRQELAQDQLELERLMRDRDLAESAYKALSDEVQISSVFQANTQILSRATAARLLGPDPKMNVILGAALGLAGGVVAAFAVQYLQDVRKKR